MIVLYIYIYDCSDGKENFIDDKDRQYPEYMGTILSLYLTYQKIIL